MIRIALENLFARKFRLLSTALSVIIGVAFLAGSLVLIDTIGRTFDDLFADINRDIDVVLRSDEAISTGGMGDIRGTIPASLLDTVRRVEGVTLADVDIEGYAQVVDRDGDPIGNPGQGAPTFGFNWSDAPELNPMRIVEGGPPVEVDDVVVDRYTADRGDFTVGDPVTILLQVGPRPFTISGVATFGDADTAAGASISIFTPDTAARVLGTPGQVDAIRVVGADGVSQEELAGRVRAVVDGTADGAGVEVLTGEAFTKETQDAVADALGFFNTFMVVFAVIALFVSAFIIANTFSIIVAQRTRELGLLRALGAKRRQLMASVLVEALVVGLVASVVGLVAGVGVADLLKRLLAGFGIDIPSGGVVFAASTVWVSLLVGVGVTVVSAILPSRRAASVTPMEALREQETEGVGALGRRLVSGAVLVVAGGSVLGWGLFGSPPSRMLAIGVGAAGLFVGVAAAAPAAIGPYARMVGEPIARWWGVPGELARENVGRNPRRASATAAALMIGVGLVSAITIFAESAKASIAAIIDDAFVGDLVIDSGAFGLGGLSPELATRLNDLPEVEAASGVRLGFAEVDGEDAVLYGVDPATMGDIVDVGVTEGAIERLGVTDLAVHEAYAADRGWTIGSPVQVRFADTGTQEFTVALLFAKDDLTGDFFVGNPAFEANFPELFDFQVYVRRDAGTTPDEARAAVEAVAVEYPNAEVQDLQEFKQAQADQIDQLLGLVYALLALAVLIALIGIANTLALSIVERTRELGLLRAVGMTRRQVRSTVRWESVLMASFGTLLGMIVGGLFGWVIVEALRSEGFSELVFPVTQLVVIALIAVVAGVVAAIRPARRAARLDILRALAQ